MRLVIPTTASPRIYTPSSRTQPANWLPHSLDSRSKRGSVLTVVLQTLDGNTLEEIIPKRAVLNGILPFGDPSFPLLRFVDEYGDTLFSTSQMEGFLPEWNVLIARAANDDEKETLLQIRRLAEKCKEEPHTFLRFAGD
jgi:hypothetical protein